MANKLCCNLFNGWAPPCTLPSGGVSKIWLACAANVTEPTIPATTGVISAFTPNPTTGDPIWKEYDVRVDTASWTGTPEENGYGFNVGQTYDIGLIFPGVDPVVVKEVNALRNSAVVAIVEDTNGNARYFGRKRPYYLRDVNDNSGTARTDNNEITTVLRGSEPDVAPFIDPTLWAKFKSPTPAASSSNL